MKTRTRHRLLTISALGVGLALAAPISAEESGWGFDGDDLRLAESTWQVEATKSEHGGCSRSYYSNTSTGSFEIDIDENGKVKAILAVDERSTTGSRSSRSASHYRSSLQGAWHGTAREDGDAVVLSLAPDTSVELCPADTACRTVGGELELSCVAVRELVSESSAEENPRARAFEMLSCSFDRDALPRELEMFVHDDAIRVANEPGLRITSDDWLTDGSALEAEILEPPKAD